MAELVSLQALTHRGSYRAQRRVDIQDVTGERVAELSLVPRLMVQRCLSAQRAAGTMPVEERRAALALAGKIFATETVNGLSPEQYHHLVCRVSGLPISVVRAASEAVSDGAVHAFETTQCARPGSAVNEWTHPSVDQGQAVWTRRGNVLGVHAAGNHPGVHSLWLEALALGYRAAVRPSQREPFTAHRLVMSLRAAGFPDDQVSLLPTDHATADELVAGSDLAMVYGGDDVMRRFATDPTVLPQGPGRSKILLAETDWAGRLDSVVASIADQGGTACVNATAVFVNGDPAPVAEAIAERLSRIPSLPPEDEAAVLPVQPIAAARAIEALLLRQARDTVPWLGGDGIVDELGDGSAVLRPAVFQLKHTDSPQAGVELGFPCVWVAPWTPAAGSHPLRNTLVLGVISEDEELLQELVDDPSISNVYIGGRPTYWMRHGIPHDRYLAEFLMRTKTVVRSRSGQ
jgi:acyl-CoA reductase-like NAD-dependent aldehyde dehydrogenase